MMKAIVLYKAGDVDNLTYEDIAQPTIRDGEVLVKVKAISVNPADVLARSTEESLTWLLGEERPVIIGWDIAGEVVEKSNNTEGFDIGDEVFGMLQFFKGGKGYAEYVAISTDLLSKKPANISFEEAAAIPIAGLTAWQPLVHKCNISPGDKVLIHGASGGVGHFAVQIAKHLGATVIATSSARNRDFLLSLGADLHIDYQAQNFWEEVDEVDYVLDMVGGETLEKSIDVVKENGKILSVSGVNESLLEKAKQKKVVLERHVTQESKADMDALADLMEKGVIKPVISKTYSFTEMKEAHTEVGSRHTRGKVVISM